MREPLATRVDADRTWLAVALGAGLLVYGTYLLTHEYPAYGAGLYLAIAEEIVAHGYRLPETIPGYTHHGVPFAYPPLFFYVAAAVRDVTGVGPLAYSRYVPGLFVVATLVPYYYLASDLLGTPRRAGIATTLYAVTPAALQWHLSAGGIVRAGAMLLTVTGAYTGLRLFRTRQRRWLAGSTVLFGLTVLSHPVYAVLFGLTYLLLWARFDPTVPGLGRGAVVAAGGVALAAPWWVTVATLHGPDVFMAAAGTHSGLGGGPGRVVTEFVYTLSPNPEMVFYLGAYPGALLLLARRRWFLPAWLAIPGFLIGKPRVQFLAGSMLTALLLTEAVLPRAARALDGMGRREMVSGGMTALVLLAAAGVGTAFATSGLQSHLGSTTQPAFIDDSDRDAMAWTSEHTAPSAEFVVLGDAAEWFPLFTDRTILVGPWGVEWTTATRYQRQLSLYKRISDCGDARCLRRSLARADVQPDYVYVPKGHYRVRGLDRRQADGMRASLVASDRYHVIYENEGVLVVRVRGTASGTGETRSADRFRGYPVYN